MARKTKYVVRVVTGPTNRDWFDNPFLECLRYAGLVTVHPLGSSEERCFDIHCPHGNNEVWAEMNAARMRSFGLNARAAPSTEEIVSPLPI